MNDLAAEPKRRKLGNVIAIAVIVVAVGLGVFVLPQYVHVCEVCGKPAVTVIFETGEGARLWPRMYCEVHTP